MLKIAMRQLRPALFMLVLLTLITGLAYPALITGVAQVLFPDKADGSLVERNGKIVGSELIGQPFAGKAHFWGRPSATSPKPYDAGNSSGSNLGPTNPDFLAAVADRVTAMRQEHKNDGPVPADLVTASASGLDPHISPAAAFYQVARVAGATGISEEKLRKLVEENVEGRQFGVLGEPRVNVLMLNIALDAMRGK